MIDITKIYYMTRAAVFEKKEKDDALKTVSYRRKDYIMLHMLVVLLSVTAGYALLIVTVLFCVLMANDEIVLKVPQMIALLLAAIGLYAVILIVYYVISHQYYGHRHVQARKKVREYLEILNGLKEYEDALQSDRASDEEEGETL